MHYMVVELILKFEKSIDELDFVAFIKSR